MKITKPGALPDEEVLKGTCTHCKCEVEFTKGEARDIQHSPKNEVYYMIDCPTKGCGRNISVET